MRAMLIALAITLSFGSVAHASEEIGTPDVAPHQVWAFCGVEPTDAHAAAKVAVFAAAGITATLGPCRQADVTYSTIHAGVRYAPPATYMALIGVNASAGLQTVVYDARLWSVWPVVRWAARGMWAPVAEHIAAFDLGDEYSIDKGEFDTMLSRYDRLLAQGLTPYTNNLPFDAELSAFIEHEPGRLLSFDCYQPGCTQAIAAKYETKAPLMCAVNTLVHLGYHPTPATVVRDIKAYVSFGCDDILIFGGELPQDNTTFHTPSLVKANGQPTAIALAMSHS